MSKRLHLIGFAALLMVACLLSTTWPAIVAEEGVIYYILTEDNEITLRYPIRMAARS